MQTNNQAHINGLPDKRMAVALTKVLDATAFETVNVSLTATDATRTVYVATYPCKLTYVNRVFSTASTSGTLTLEKCTGTTAPGSGTALLTATVALSGTANTTVAGTPVATTAVNMAVGDRLGIVIAGTMTSLAGCVVGIQVAQL